MFVEKEKYFFLSFQFLNGIFETDAILAHFKRHAVVLLKYTN